MSSSLSEHDYITLSEPSSEPTTSITTMAEKPDQTQSTSVAASERSSNFQVDLNLRATELRLGPPGSTSPEWQAFPAEEFGGYQLGFLKNSGSGAKRGFSDVKSEKWVWAGNGDLGEGGVESGSGSDGSSMALEKKPQNHNSSAALHASKAQVVGWPPIRSFRKNTMATNPPKTDNKPLKTDNKPESKLEGARCVYVKVSMDNAPYLRKVDLTTYRSYADLSSALEKMFSCFTIGQYGYNGVPGRDGLSLSDSRLKDIHNSEQRVLTYEDKDGDWMLVGDVPWDMFTNTCRRIGITKSSEAIGLAPRAMEKCKNEE